ncbi:hypothetical protein SAMN05444000_11386 [Shimia gijangensis]|uniref:Uncharacterized protein n=1 Tax=Shimia gijangensis TaxID=1470563 RepID=A0A1M6MAQ9_9RHOB|nr:hypothetical protein SAMN05444000_11386 [Shimia gijangensis]
MSTTPENVWFQVPVATFCPIINPPETWCRYPLFDQMAITVVARPMTGEMVKLTVLYNFREPFLRFVQNFPGLFERV